jgi:hypothetical protein
MASPTHCRRRAMAIERWKPSRVYTAQERFLLKRLKRVKKLFAFLRNHRHELFDDAFQALAASWVPWGREGS